MNERLSKAGEETSWPGLEDDEDEGKGENPTEVVVDSSASVAAPTQTSASSAVDTAGSASNAETPSSNAESPRS